MNYDFVKFAQRVRRRAFFFRDTNSSVLLEFMRVLLAFDVGGERVRELV